jgi:hypothetical protein
LEELEMWKYESVQKYSFMLKGNIALATKHMKSGMEQKELKHLQHFLTILAKMKPCISIFIRYNVQTLSVSLLSVLFIGSSPS